MGENLAGFQCPGPETIILILPSSCQALPGYHQLREPGHPAFKQPSMRKGAVSQNEKTWEISHG